MWRMAARLEKAKNADNGLGRELERKLWTAADKLWGAMDAAEYKHVVLGLIFLKYISDAFEAKHAELEAERSGRRPSRTRINTALPTSSGCRRKRAGDSSRCAPSSPRSAS